MTGPDHTDPEWLEEAYARTGSQIKMAKEAGVSQSTIKYHMNKHDISAQNGVPKASLRTDLRRVAEDLGRAPGYRKYDDRGEYSSKTVANQLGDGSWNEALRSVGLEPNQLRDIPENDIREDLRRIAEDLGRVPGQQEYDDRGDYGYETVARVLGDGSWNEALRSVGLEPNMLMNISEASLRADLRRVAEDLGRAPSYRKYDDRGEYGYRTVAKVLGDGSWNEALRSVGLEPNKHWGVPKNNLREDLRRVAEDLGRVPGRREYDDQGDYGYRTVANRLGGGSWREALRSCDLWPIDHGGVAMRSSYEPAVASRLDGLGLSWWYEPAELATPAGGYTPDFVLADGTIFEVKGMPREQGKAPKLRALMEGGSRVVVVGTDWWRGRLPCNAFVPYDGGETPGLADALGVARQ